MRTIARRLTVVVAAGALLLSAAVLPASAEPQYSTSVERQVLSLGDGWYINSPTTVKTTTEDSEQVQNRTVAGDSQAQVLPPINPDGSSVWPAKRGVIPVQFKVNQATKTEERVVTTTTTTVSKTPSFQSVCGPNDTTPSILGLYDEIPAGTTVEDITKVQAGFTWPQGSSVGGSLRWDIGTDLGDIHIYYGDSHNWTGTGGADVNLMDATDDRFDDSNTSVAGGTFYNTKQQILDKFQGVGVNNVSLVVDSCWTGVDQELSIDYAAVGINGANSTSTNPLDEQVGTPTQVVTEGTWTEVSSTAPVQTNEPDAKLVVKKYNDGDPVEVLSETLTSAQADVGGNFRKVDGKYLYNLEASSLGKGDFQVFIQIGGVNLSNPGAFTLR